MSKKKRNDVTGTEMEEAIAETAESKAKEKQNGITRPSQEGAVKRVWDLCDAYYQQTNNKPDKAAIVDAAYKEGINPATAITQVGRWLRYYGMSTPRVATTDAEKIEKEITAHTESINKMTQKIADKQQKIATLQARLVEIQNQA